MSVNPISAMREIMMHQRYACSHISVKTTRDLRYLSTIRPDNNVEKRKQIMIGDRPVTTRKIVDDVGMSAGSGFPFFLNSWALNV